MPGVATGPHIHVGRPSWTTDPLNNFCHSAKQWGNADDSNTCVIAALGLPRLIRFNPQLSQQLFDVINRDGVGNATRFLNHGFLALLDKDFVDYADDLARGGCKADCHYCPGTLWRRVGTIIGGVRR